MPVNLGQDNNGCFARWGKQGKKYYYECGNEQARKDAKRKAFEQGLAAGIKERDFRKSLTDLVGETIGSGRPF